jgi:transcriptional regulator with XRE-family HTH domain
MASPRFSQLLVDLRVNRGFGSSRGFAALTSLSRETVRAYETGRAIPTNESLLRIFDTLSVSVDSEEAKGIISSICQAREERAAPKKRSYGVAATKELRRHIKDNNSVDKDRVDQLVNLFFDQFEEDRRTESFEFYIRQKIEGILGEE